MRSVKQWSYLSRHTRSRCCRVTYVTHGIVKWVCFFSVSLLTFVQQNNEDLQADEYLTSGTRLVILLFYFYSIFILFISYILLDWLGISGPEVGSRWRRLGRSAPEGDRWQMSIEPPARLSLPESVLALEIPITISFTFLFVSHLLVFPNI